MKFKHVISTLALAMVTAFGVAAAVAPAREAKEVRADSDTWMINVTFDGGVMMSFEGIDANSFVFRCGKDGQGGWKEQSMSLSGADNLLHANVSFASDFEFNRVQIKCKQGSADKYSKTYTVSGTEASHYGSYNISYSSWTSENFDISLQEASAPYFTYNSANVNFVEDIAGQCFKKIDFEFDGSETFALRYGSSWNYTYDVLTDNAKQYLKGSHASHWVVFEAGHYDIFLKNDGGDGGILDVKKYETEVDTYIYYVTNSDSATIDYIYSFGGESQFGAFPGAAIATVGTEVTNNGVLHFQGSETPKLIYRIPVSIGYPDGDLEFEFNNGKSKYDGGAESDAFELVGGAAYWWAGGANANAGTALDFLVRVEEARNAVVAGGNVKEDSICGIDATASKNLYNAYIALDEGIRTTYIDCTTVYTYKADKSEGNELVAYSAVMQRLGVQGGVLPASVLHPVGFVTKDNSASIAMIIIISAVSIAAFGAVIILKKRKEN